MTDFYDAQTRRQHSIAAAESFRKEPPSFDTTPIEGLEDYGSCGMTLSSGVAHLDEAIPNGQKRRAEEAAELAVRGLQGTLAWLCAKGLRVPAIVVIDFDAPTPAETEGVYKRQLRLVLAAIEDYMHPGGQSEHDALTQIIGLVDPWPVARESPHLVQIVSHPYARLEANVSSHDLYTDADQERPDVICDSNGQVVLGLCKRCGKGESELEQACLPRSAIEPQAEMVLVPRIPTRAMLDAAQWQRRDHLETPSMSVHESAERVWDSMLAAYPQVPLTAQPTDTQRLDWLFAHCRIVYFPPESSGGTYPIEHNPHALGYGKDRHNTPILAFADAAIAAQAAQPKDAA